jgi:hypothetical protein
VPGANFRNVNPRYFDGPMEQRAVNHDSGAKVLLNGATSPPGL